MQVQKFSNILALLLLQSLLVPPIAQGQSFGQLKTAAQEAQAAKKYAEADEFWKKAINSCDDQTGPRFIQSTSGLAKSLAEQGKTNDAENEYKRILLLCKPGMLSEDCKTALIDYASFLRKQNRESEAVSLESKFALGQELEQNKPGLPASNPAISTKEMENKASQAALSDWQNLLNKGNKKLNARQFPQAEQSFKQSLAIAEKLYDANLLKKSLNSLNAIYLAQNKLNLAEPILRKLSEATKSSNGAASREYAKALNEHANLLRKLNRKPEAIAEEARADDILAKLAPSNSNSGSSSGANDGMQGNLQGTRGGSLRSRAGAAQGINSGKNYED